MGPAGLKLPSGNGLTVTDTPGDTLVLPSASVTVTVKSPDSYTTIEGVVAPLLHRYSYPGLDVRITESPSQTVVSQHVLINACADPTILIRTNAVIKRHILHRGKVCFINKVLKVKIMVMMCQK